MVNTRRIWVFVLLFCLFDVVSGQIPISSPSAQSHSSVSAMFILGDSSVNCGDNTFVYNFVPPDHSSSHPCLGSQSRLLPHLLAEKLGLPKIPAFYSQNGTIKGLVSGLNFGSSQATIMTSGHLGFQALNQQLRQAFETLQMLQLQLGLEKAQDLVQTSLFYISLGKDDYIQYLLHNSSSKRPKYSSGGYAHILVKQMIRVVKDLYNANVRKMVFMGIGPLGCTPRALWESNNSTGGIKRGRRYCVEEINKLILQYNSMLSHHLADLNYELLDAKIIFCDIYQGMMQIITDPKRFGFSNVKRACCGFGRYGGRVGCISEELACDDPSTHVWWDYYNPTQGVNSLLANWTWSGQPFNICHPVNIENFAS